MITRADLIDGLVEAACAAGGVIWDHFGAGEVEVVTKADESPVTAADREAEAVILAALARLDPQTPVVAEEEVSAGRIPAVGSRFWLVDPLDGTRDFVRKGKDFTVNIGLVEHGRATLGIIYAPAHDALYVGDLEAGEAWTAPCAPHGAIGARAPLRVKPPGERLVAVASRSHGDPVTDRYLASLPIADRVSVGSSLKFCLVAAGQADIYPRAVEIMEWDTCAGQAVLEAAGGACFGPDGAPFRYGKPGFRNTAFVATGGFTATPIASVLSPR